MKNIADLKSLLQQRTWDKEVLLWLGPEKSLMATLGASKHVILDLLDLFPPGDLPPDDDATAQTLRLQLRHYLRALPNGPGHRPILVVKSIGLLARYRVGLNEFYDWFVGSHSLLVLLLEDVPEKILWPDEVRCDVKRLPGYFTEPGMVKEVYAATG